MVTIARVLREVVQNLVAFVSLIILGIISFFFMVIIVTWEATLAGFEDHDDVVLSAAILAGGISPLGYTAD